MSEEKISEGPNLVWPLENLDSEIDVPYSVKAESILANGWEFKGEYPVVRLDDFIDWNNQDTSLRAWIFRIHCWDMLFPLLAAYSENGDLSILAKAIPVALDWASRYTDISSGGDPSGFAWYDMAVGIRTVRLAYLVDAALYEGLLNDEQTNLLMRCLQSHRCELEDEGKILFHNNHGFYQVVGQLALGRRFSGRLEGMTELWNSGQERLLRIVETQFSEEGVHCEHSPDYHRMVYISLSSIIKAGLCKTEEVVKRLALIESRLAWFVYPDGILVNLGDSDSRDMRLSSRLALKQWQDSGMQYVASLGSAGSAPESKSLQLHNSGYFIARNNWEMGSAEAGYMLLNAAFHSRTHKHADNLSLLWYERGRSVFIDSGRYGYIGKTQQGSESWLAGYWYDDPVRMYMESTRAHNTVSIDDKDHPRRGYSPYGSALGRCGEIDGIHFSEAELRYPEGIRHARTVLWLPGFWLLTLDWVHDNHAVDHVFKQHWNWAPDFDVKIYESGFHGTAGDTDIWLVPVLSRGLGQSGRVEALFDDAGGQYSPQERRVMPVHSVFFQGHGRQVIFSTLAAIGKDAPVVDETNEAVLSGRNYRLRFKVDGRWWNLRVARPADGAIQIKCSTEHG